MQCIYTETQKKLPPFKPVNINNNTAYSKCANLFVDNSVLTVRQNGHAYGHLNLQWSLHGTAVEQLFWLSVISQGVWDDFNELHLMSWYWL